MLQSQRLANSDFFKHKSINDSLKNSLNFSVSNIDMIVQKSSDPNDVSNSSGFENSVFFASESSVRRK